MTGSIHEVTLGLDTRCLLNCLSEVSLMWNLNNVLPHTCIKFQWKTSGKILAKIGKNQKKLGEKSGKK